MVTDGSQRAGLGAWECFKCTCLIAGSRNNPAGFAAIWYFIVG